MARVIVCGGRSFQNYDTLEKYLDMLHALHGFDVVIHGAAIGADLLAHNWALSHHVDIRQFRADWKTYKKAAGPIRNKQMLDEGRPDLVIAFPGGKGTSNMKMQANMAGVEVLDLSEEHVRRSVERQYEFHKARNGGRANLAGEATDKPR